MHTMKYPFTRRMVPFLLLAIALVPVAVPYLQPGFQFADDLHAPYLRVIALRQAIADGQIPPRWFSEFDGGYGSPYPTFYAMLFYGVAVAFNVLGLSVGSAVELTAYAVIVLAALGMFMLVRSLWGEESGVLAAVLYTYAPYHLVDAFVRGALSELAALAWFPFLVYASYQWILSRHGKWLALSSLSIGGLILTHNLMPILFLPLFFGLLLAVVILGQSPASPALPRIRAMVVCCGLGLLTVAYFWLPIALERGFLRLDYFLQYDYRGDFVGRATLFAWSSASRPYTSIGLLLVISAIVGVLVALPPRTQSPHRLLALGSLAAGFFCLFMANSRSGWIWARLPLLQFVQFPWRFLAPATFFLALAAGPLPRAFRSGLAAWGVVIVLGAAIYLQSSPLIRIRHRIDAATLQAFRLCEAVSETQDFRPQTSQTLFWRGTSPPADAGDPLLLIPCATGVSLSPAGEARVLSSTRRGTRWDVRVSVDRQAVVTIPQFYFPGWAAWVDGEPAAVKPSQGKGLMEITLPAGAHTLRVDFLETTVRRVGNVMSLVGAAIFLGVFWLGSRAKGAAGPD